MDMTAKQELNFIVCGGAGINIAKLLKTSSPSDRVKNASYVALDASGNNRLPEELGIPLERVPASGNNWPRVPVRSSRPTTLKLSRSLNAS